MQAIDELSAVRSEIALLQSQLKAAPKRTRADVLAALPKAIDHLEDEAIRAADIALAAFQGGRPLNLQLSGLSPGATALLVLGRSGLLKLLTARVNKLPVGLPADERQAIDAQLDALQKREVALMAALRAGGTQIDPRPDADPVFELLHDADA